MLVSLYVFRSLSDSNISNVLLLLVEKLSFSHLFLLAIFLVPLNYYLESLKWHFLVKKVQPFTFFQAFSGVLAGMAASFATPGGLGDYFGRILHASPGSREKLPAILLMCRMSQMVLTLFFGSLCIIFLLTYNKILASGLVWIGAACAISFSLSVIIFIYRIRIVNYILKKQVGLKLKKYVEVAATFSSKEIGQLFFLAFIRHMIFILQFVLLLSWFGVSDDYFLLFLGVNFIFLCKSILPVFFELGAREYAAVIFFSFFGLAVEPALLACLMLWLLNIVVPSLAGLPFLLRLKASAS